MATSPQDSDRLQAALKAIDERNSADPNREQIDGEDIAKEVLYSRRMSEQLQSFAPDASEALRIATHAQHIERWRIPRADYPKTRIGYLTWRRDLGRFHGDTTAEILRSLNYDEATIAQVQSLLMKQNLRQNQDAQTLEDVACLVFLQYHLADFAEQHDSDKIISIIQKTWNKMSSRGHEAALALPLDDVSAQWVKRALA